MRDKIILTGPSGVGTTTALRTLSDRPPQRVRLAVGSGPNGRLELEQGTVDLTADLAIQLYAAPESAPPEVIQRLFLKDALGVLILLDNRSESPHQDLEEYLSSFRQLIELTHVAVGITATDSAPQPTTADYYRALPRGALRPPIFEVDCQSKADLSLLAQALLYGLDPGLPQ